MQTATIKAKLEQIGIEVDSLVDEKTKEAIYLLFNLIEELSSTVRKLQEENQRLRDEIRMQYIRAQDIGIFQELQYTHILLIHIGNAYKEQGVISSREGRVIDGVEVS